MKRILLWSNLVLISSLLSLSSCIKYSLSGASTNAKTIQVSNFFNNTELGAANLGQTFTNLVKDYFQRNSSLRVVSTNGELQIEGTIVTYSTAPQSPQASSGSGVSGSVGMAQETRLTIGVRVNYVDGAEPKNSFKDKLFTFYADYSNDKDFITVQQELEKKIFDQIMIDIFNSTIATW